MLATGYEPGLRHLVGPAASPAASPQGGSPAVDRGPMRGACVPHLLETSVAVVRYRIGTSTKSKVTSNPCTQMRPVVQYQAAAVSKRPKSMDRTCSVAWKVWVMRFTR
jgi:hypothetical protein